MNPEQKKRASLMLLQVKKLNLDLERETRYQKEHIELFGRTHACAEEVFASIITRARALKRNMESFRDETKQDPFNGVVIPDTLPEDL